MEQGQKSNEYTHGTYHFSYDIKEDSKYGNEEIRLWILANILLTEPVKNNLEIESPVETTIVFKHKVIQTSTIIKEWFDLVQIFNKFVYSCFSKVAILKFKDDSQVKTLGKFKEGDHLILINPKPKPTKEEFDDYIEEIYLNRKFLADIENAGKPKPFPLPKKPNQK